jgi:hypothetical protein
LLNIDFAAVTCQLIVSLFQQTSNRTSTHISFQANNEVSISSFHRFGRHGAIGCRCRKGQGMRDAECGSLNSAFIRPRRQRFFMQLTHFFFSY